MQNEYDVAIIGGGMVGSALACALGGSRLRVAVVEKFPADASWSAESVDLRVSAITRASQHIFEALGAWQGMAERRISPYTDMEVWDAMGGASIHFDAAEVGQSYLGHIIENRVIQLALWERLESIDNVTRIFPAGLESFEVDGEGVDLLLDNGERLRSKLIVGADGANSKVLEIAGSSVGGWMYDQHALVATVRTEHSHLNTAWQRFLPEGPLAFLPISDGRASIVWSCRPERAEALAELDEASFCKALGEDIDHRLGQITAVEGRGVYPLRLRHVDHYVHPRVALVGDAAHSIHPLAGQGVNIGLLDAASLAEVVLQGVEQRRDIGEVALLRRYERWRKGQNLLMMGSMDAFKRSFGSQQAPIRLARNLGLAIADRITPLKSAIMRRAMGLGGDLPKLAQPPRY